MVRRATRRESDPSRVEMNRRSLRRVNHALTLEREPHQRGSKVFSSETHLSDEAPVERTLHLKEMQPDPRGA